MMMAQQEALAIAIEKSHMRKHELEKDFGPRLWWQLGILREAEVCTPHYRHSACATLLNDFIVSALIAIDKQHVPICSSSSTSRPRAHSCWGWKAAFALDLRSPHVSIIKSVVSF